MTDMSKYSLKRDAVRKLTRRTQFFPYEATGNHKIRVLAFWFVPPSDDNQNRASYRAKVEIVDSDKDIFKGRQYELNFVAGRQGARQDYSDRDQVNFIASALKADLTAEDFDEDEVRNELLRMSDEGELEKEEVCLFMTRTTKKKEVAVKKNGQAVLEEKQYSNDYYSPC